jgi:hypothetical protein
MEEEAAENSTSHDRLLATVSKLEARNKVLVKRQASQVGSSLVTSIATLMVS